jgi:hypothetical protein
MSTSGLLFERSDMSISGLLFERSDMSHRFPGLISFIDSDFALLFSFNGFESTVNIEQKNILV